jgi:aryl-alcohol dehydrogenase-like predicted oxidoreductase
MKTRMLGRKGPAVSAIGLGCMGMSWSYHPIHKSTQTADVARAQESLKAYQEGKRRGKTK